MKKSLCFAVMLWAALWLQAQFGGGLLSYRSLGANAYSVALTTYSDSATAQNECHAIIELWNATGTTLLSRDTINRQNGNPAGCDTLTTLGEPMRNATFRNRYEIVYPSLIPDRYLLRFHDGHYATRITNLQAPDAFWIEMEVWANPFLGTNSSPTVGEDSLPIACMGSDWIYDPQWVDSDADSMVFQVATPLGVAGYASPSLYADSFFVGPQDGLLHLLNPAAVGTMVFQIQCDEYRNGQKIGSTAFLQSIFVKDSCTNVAVDASLYSRPLVISPNPTTTTFSLTLPTHFATAQIQIRNPQGRAVAPPQAYTGTPVDVSALARGLYFIEVSWRGGRSVLKLLKE